MVVMCVGVVWVGLRLLPGVATTDQTQAALPRRVGTSNHTTPHCYFYYQGKIHHLMNMNVLPTGHQLDAPGGVVLVS